MPKRDALLCWIRSGTVYCTCRFLNWHFFFLILFNLEYLFLVKIILWHLRPLIARFRQLISRKYRVLSIQVIGRILSLWNLYFFRPHLLKKVAFTPLVLTLRRHRLRLFERKLSFLEGWNTTFSWLVPL